MKKMKLLTLNNIMYALATILGVVAICLMFAPSISYTVTVLGKDVTTAYTGVQVTFGHNVKDVAYLAFSFMNMLSYVLLLVAVVLTVLKLCGVLKSNIVNYVIVALYVVSAIFFFCTVSFTVFGEYFETLKNIEWKLGVGAIVSGVLSIVSALLVLLTVVLKPKKTSKK